NGDAVSIWSSNGVITSVYRPAGGTWGPRETVGVSDNCFQPDVAMDSNGNAVAVWTCTPTGASRVRTSTRPNGGSWSTPVVLANNASNPQVSIDPQGNATAVWEKSNTVESATMPAGGSFGPPETISVASQQVYQPKVAA